MLILKMIEMLIAILLVYGLPTLLGLTAIGFIDENDWIEFGDWIELRTVKLVKRFKRSES